MRVHTEHFGETGAQPQLDLAALKSMRMPMLPHNGDG